MSKLIYKKWADNRNEILPVGNGRIGAMIYGNPLCDVLSLNEETLWSGGPEGEIKPYDMEIIKESQKLLSEKKYMLLADALLLLMNIIKKTSLLQRTERKVFLLLLK